MARIRFVSIIGIVLVSRFAWADVTVPNKRLGPVGAFPPPPVIGGVRFSLTARPSHGLDGWELILELDTTVVVDEPRQVATAPLGVSDEDWTGRWMCGYAEPPHREMHSGEQARFTLRKDWRMRRGQHRDGFAVVSVPDSDCSVPLATVELEVPTVGPPRTLVRYMERTR